jgi:hypothetical protein
MAVPAARDDDPLPLYVVCGGPLTNVAAALDQDPSIATRMSLVWIGGSLDVEAFEYNRDTDPVAADFVFGRRGLVVHQFPLETYRQCAYSVHELAEDVGRSGRIGAWLWDHYQTPPEWVQLGGIWPLGDSPPVLITALGRTFDDLQVPEKAERRVLTEVDFRLLVGDMLARFRLHRPAGGGSAEADERPARLPTGDFR